MSNKPDVATKSAQEPGGLTRRSFVEVAMGTLATLPFAAAGSFILAPAGTALAEETSTSQSEVDGGDATNGKTLKIIAAKPYEASFVVADMSDGAKTAIKGAHVRVTRRGGNEAVEGDTNESGLVMLDVAKLCDNPRKIADPYKLTRFEFEGSISVTCKGYRDFEVPLTNIEGGLLLEVPTRKLTDGIPYPSSAALSGYDMLYTKNEFLLHADNKSMVDATVTVKNLGSGDVTLSITRGKTGEAIAQQKVAPKSGVATVTFKQELLQRGSSKALAEKDNYLRIEQGGKTFVAELSPKLSPGVSGKAPDKKDVHFAPLSTDAKAVSGIGLKWPASFPVIGGSQINIWTPDWLVNVDYNPFGYLRVTIPLKRGGKEINTDTKKWSEGFSMPRKTIAQQWGKLMDTAKSMSDKTGGALSGGNIEKIDTFGSVAFKLNFQLVLGAQWDTGTGALQYSGGIQLFGSMDASYTLNYMLGPVPALITFAFNATADATGSLGGKLVQKDKSRSFVNDMFDWSLVQWDPANTALSFRITPTVSVSVGVGIRGVASISVKGSLGLVFYIGWAPGAPAQGKSACHVILGYIARLDLVLHMFLFTKTFLLLNGSKPTWQDNWKNKLGTQADEDEYLDPYGSLSLEQLADELEFIEDEMLDEVCEDELGIIGYGEPESADENWQPDEAWCNQEVVDEDWGVWYEDGDGDFLSTQSAEELANKELAFERDEDLVTTLEDGTTVGYYVYSFGLKDKEQPLETASEKQDEKQQPADETKQDAEQDVEKNAGQDSKQGATTDDPAAKDGTQEAVGDTTERGAVSEGQDQPSAGEKNAANGAGTPEGDSDGVAKAGAAAAAAAAVAGGTVASTTEGATPIAEDAAQGIGSVVKDLSATATAPADVSDANAANAAVNAAADTATNAAADAAADAAAGGSASPAGAAASAGTEATARADESAQAEAGGAQAGAEGTKLETASDEGAQNADAQQVEAAQDSDLSVAANDKNGATHINGAYKTAVDAKVGVSGLGVTSGLRPSSDTKLNSNVFGDPRAKIVSFKLGNSTYTYLFRLGTSKVRHFEQVAPRRWKASLQTRTRLIATSLEGGAAGTTHTFDVHSDPRKLRSGFARWDYYDYDFDLEYIPGSNIISIVLICGKRPLDTDSGEKKALTLDGAMAETAFVFFKLRTSDIMSGRSRNATTWFVRTAQEVFGDGAQDKIHSISNIQCHLADQSMLVTYLDRCVDKGKTRELVASNDVDVKLGIMFVNFGARKTQDAVKVAKWSDISAKIGALSKDVYEMDVSPLVAGQHTIMLRGGDTVQFLLMKVNAKSGTISNIEKTKNTYKFDKNNPVTSMPPRLIPWPGHDAFLCSHDGKLQKAEWKGGELTYTPVGPTNYGIQAFGISSRGNLIFWPQSRDGEQVQDVDKNGELKAGNEKVCHIMACRMWGKDHFSDPFVIADLPHDADQLSVVGVQGSALDLLITEVAKTAKAKKDKSGEYLEYGANLWRTRIPHVKSVTALGAEAPNPRVAPGSEAPFDVTVRNDGNMFLSGCTIAMFLDGQEVSSKELTFSKDSLRESTFNESDGKGNLQGVESDYALAPGKTQVHRVSIPIPSDWHGEKKVAFQARLPKEVKSGGLYNQAEEDEWNEGEVLEYVTEPVEVTMDSLWTLEDETEWDDLNDAPVEALAIDNGTGGTPATNTAEKTRAKPRLPQTADPNAPALLPAALAAAGAAALAYERRRAKYENAEEDED